MAELKIGDKIGRYSVQGTKLEYTYTIISETKTQVKTDIGFGARFRKSYDNPNNITRIGGGISWDTYKLIVDDSTKSD